MIKVSIVIPVYNQEKYLDECLLSVVNQTLKEIEIICVNDGSTDKSLEMLKEWKEKDDRIIVITGSNGGYGKAMNKGLDVATGEYVGIVEPDDYINLKMYETLYTVAKKNNLDICKSDFYRFFGDSNGNIRFDYAALSRSIDDYGVIFSPKENKKSFDYYMATCCGIYRRDFLRENNIRYNETPGASYQDNGFYFKTFTTAKRIMIIKEALYNVRRDNPNSSVHQKDKVYTADKEFDFIKENLVKDNLWDEFKLQYNKLRILTGFFTIDRVGIEYKEEYAYYLKNYIEESIENGELDWSLYDNNQKRRINKLIISPSIYVNELNRPQISANDKVINDVKEQLNVIKNSISYKLGLKITYIPRKIYHIVRGE